MKQIHNLVLSGGGLRGYSYMALLKIIEENPKMFKIKKIAATSVGSIFAVLIAMCVSYDELYEKAIEKDINDFQHIKLDNILKFMERFGVDDGSLFINFIAFFVSNKLGNTEITLKETYDITGVELYITGTCLNTKDSIYFSHNNYPDMPLLLAIRISISIPFYFIPIYYENKLFVDGGVVDNFPVQLFENEMEHTLGIYLQDNRAISDNIHNFEDYAYKLYISNNGSKNIQKVETYKPYCLIIPLNDIGIYTKTITIELRKEWESIAYNLLNAYLKKRILYPPLSYKEYLKEIECTDNNKIIKEDLLKFKQEIYDELRHMIDELFTKKIKELENKET
jgi:predicted acylesterase/phospholipase RssA